MLAAVSGRSAVGPRGPRVFQIFLPRVKLHPVKQYASGGGLLVAPIHVPHLLAKSLFPFRMLAEQPGTRYQMNFVEHQR